MDITPLAARTAASPPARDKATNAATDADAAALRAAEAFETSFLAEMLKESGVNQASSSFGGGAGEEAFSSFLTEQYAAKLAGRAELGLSQRIFEALKARGTGA
ncbi:rod-binding protein [Amaricoccus sp. W119]|uniref:rod-binding protein n=1 Tax=Amaricoccus sp. W119 TaxID=3391833 RepID=UPI0039A601E8